MSAPKGHQRTQSEESFDEPDDMGGGGGVQQHHHHHHRQSSGQQATVVVGRPLNSTSSPKEAGGGSKGSSAPSRGPSSLAAAFLGLPAGSEAKGRTSPGNNSNNGDIKRSVSDEFINKGGNRSPDVLQPTATLGPPPSSSDYSSHSHDSHLNPPQGLYSNKAVPMAPPAYTGGSSNPGGTPGRLRGFSGSSNQGSSFGGGSSGPTHDDGGRMSNAFAAPAPLPSFLRKPGSSNSVGGTAGGSGNTTPNNVTAGVMVGGDGAAPPPPPFGGPGAPPVPSGSGGGSATVSPLGGVPIPQRARGETTPQQGSSLGGGSAQRFSHNPYARSPANRSPRQGLIPQ